MAAIPLHHYGPSLSSYLFQFLSQNVHATITLELLPSFAFNHFDFFIIKYLILSINTADVQIDKAKFDAINLKVKQLEVKVKKCVASFM